MVGHTITVSVVSVDLGCPSLVISAVLRFLHQSDVDVVADIDLIFGRVGRLPKKTVRQTPLTIYHHELFQVFILSFKTISGVHSGELFQVVHLKKSSIKKLSKMSPTTSCAT